jgi:threonine dehydratase
MSKPENAAAPLVQVVRQTTIICAPKLAKRLGVDLTIATETFQHTGSFKFRAAYNMAANIPQHRIIAASSGNFGQAVAYACSLLGKQCTIVMPATSAKVKIDAVREYGGTVDLVDVKMKSRAQRVSELSTADPDAYIASAYDDPLVIDGNASLGRELAKLDREFDYIVSPVGGGGLISGLIKGTREGGKTFKIVGAEPAMANDAARSLRAGHIVRNETEPQTIADGARTLSVGNHNWAVMKDGVHDIVEVPEDNIKEGIRALFSFANLKAEPTGALSIGALLTHPEMFSGRSVCCVISGGNVDPELYRSVLGVLI